MSIRQYIGLLVRHGKLARYRPFDTTLPLKRRLYLTESALKDLNDPKRVLAFYGSRGRVEAAFIRWTTNGLVFGDEKGKNVFLKRLCPPPHDVWEMRITDPRPQIRFLGCFGDKNTLILMRAHTRDFLGNKGSANWADAMKGCADDWQALFATHAPHKGAKISDFVSENYDDYPICP